MRVETPTEQPACSDCVFSGAYVSVCRVHFWADAVGVQKVPVMGPAITKHDLHQHRGSSYFAQLKTAELAESSLYTPVCGFEGPNMCVSLVP